VMAGLLPISFIFTSNALGLSDWRRFSRSGRRLREPNVTICEQAGNESKRSLF